MGYVTVSLKIPDEQDYIALTRVLHTGKTEIIGYISVEKFQAFLYGSGSLIALYEDFLNR